MDTLYTGDIPKDYKYIFLSNGYIYLYDKPQAYNETINCFKIDNSNGFYYCHDVLEVTDIVNFDEVQVTDKHYYRTDYFNILSISCMLGLILVFITNIVTSFIRRGGLLGGLF